MTGEPQVGDVLEFKHLMCVVVRVFHTNRRMVEVIWLSDDYPFTSTHVGYHVNWKDWVRVCGNA